MRLIRRTTNLRNFNIKGGEYSAEGYSKIRIEGSKNYFRITVFYQCQFANRDFELRTFPIELAALFFVTFFWASKRK